MLGQRNVNYRREIGVSSIADRVRLHPSRTLPDAPETIAAQAAADISAEASGFWLHVDLDALDRTEFRACGAASDPAMPGGLTWARLTAITSTALQIGGCRGWSIGVYNPDHDPDGSDADRIVRYLARVTESKDVRATV